MLFTRDPQLLADNVMNLPQGLHELRDQWCARCQVPVEQLFSMGVFGDGVPHQKNKSIECLTWNLLGLGTHSKRYLAGCIPKAFTCKCGCGGKHTLDAMHQILAWSFKLLWLGRFPTCRHDGEPWHPQHDKARSKLTGPLGFYGALLQVRGDWAWYKQAFGFPSWASLQICWRCMAGVHEHPWTDFSMKATWRHTQLTSAEFT